MGREADQLYPHLVFRTHVVVWGAGQGGGAREREREVGEGRVDEIFSRGEGGGATKGGELGIIGGVQESKLLRK